MVSAGGLVPAPPPAAGASLLLFLQEMNKNNTQYFFNEFAKLLSKRCFPSEKRGSGAFSRGKMGFSAGFGRCSRAFLQQPGRAFCPLGSGRWGPLCRVSGKIYSNNSVKSFILATVYDNHS